MTTAPNGDGLPADAHARVDERDAVLVSAVIDALPSPTLVIDADGTVLLANSSWVSRASMLGADLLTGVGGNYFDMALAMSHDSTNRHLIAQLNELSRGERRTVESDYALPHRAGVIWFHLQASRVGGGGQLVVTHTDVTSRVRAERASAWRARHDHLTTLPNRSHLHDLIDAELERGATPVAVLFLDVDGFKDVNDSLGHEAGDELLRQLSGRLIQETRAEDSVGRLGGDEFVVLCRDCDTEGAEFLAQRFRGSFERPFVVAGRPVRLTASIGIAGAPARDATVRSTDLVRDADLAMYAAKAAGRNRVRVFSPDLRAAAQRKMELAVELREAIAGDQLVLHYQPVLQLPGGDVAGAEALLRWQHPVRGLIPPGEFIPLAEQSDLIRPLTRWVLGEAARQGAEWVRRGLPLLVGVNVSAAALSDETLVGDVAQALAASGLAPEHLIVELTESSVAEDAESAAGQFAALRLTGVEVAIDDFGAGYSSLGQLLNIPAGVLKIDRSLVTGAADRPSQSAAAIAAVVGLAQACGMRSLAEGVETAEQLALATELGCTFVQGFYIARPMPAEDIEPWILARRARVEQPATRSVPA